MNRVARPRAHIEAILVNCGSGVAPCPKPRRRGTVQLVRRLPVLQYGILGRDIDSRAKLNGLVPFRLETDNE
jgi:hypothetical protein